MGLIGDGSRLRIDLKVPAGSAKVGDVKTSLWCLLSIDQEAAAINDKKMADTKIEESQSFRDTALDDRKVIVRVQVS